MTVIQFAALSAILLGGVAAPIHAQTAPGRDAESRPTIGTATISGVVVDDEADPKPARRVVVSLTGPALRPSRGAVTDDDGRFTIAQLPGGRFTLTATRAAFITSMYGAKRPGRVGTAVAVADGQRVEVRMTIWRGAVIAGVVRDEHGVPVAGLPVTAAPSRPATGTLLTLTNNGAETNERGEYRIFGLEPGVYVVSAKPPDRGGGPLTAMSDADVDAAFEAIRTRSTAPTTGAVATGAAGGQPLVPFAYAPVFYPGTTRRSQATPIPIGAGQEASNIDLQLARVNTSTIEGVVMAPGNQPIAGASLQLTPVAAPFSPEGAAPINARAGRDGRFSIAQVVPGDYDLLVSADTAGDRAGGATGGRGRSLWGRAVVSVAGGDLLNVIVSVDSGIALSGQIRLESAARQAVRLPDVSQWRLAFVPPSELHLKYGTPNQSMATHYGINAASDGTFAASALAPVTYAFVVAGREITSDGWRLKSAILNGRDLLDKPFELTAADSAGSLVVTATTKHTTVAGRLQTSSGAPASDVFVVAFTTDASLWGPGARRVRAVRPDVDGRYHFDDLPPGEYRIAAVTDVDPDEWQDPSFLAALVPASVTFTVADADGDAPTLRIGGIY